MTAPVDRIHAGVDLVLTALAEHRALKAGEDPELAADVAEGETAVRRMWRANKCKHCKAVPGRPCVDAKGRPLTKTPCHDCRMREAS